MAACKKQARPISLSGIKFALGGHGEIRTRNQELSRDPLYPLSYVADKRTAQTRQRLGRTYFNDSLRRVESLYSATAWTQHIVDNVYIQRLSHRFRGRVSGGLPGFSGGVQTSPFGVSDKRLIIG